MYKDKNAHQKRISTQRTALAFPACVPSPMKFLTGKMFAGKFDYLPNSEQ